MKKLVALLSMVVVMLAGLYAQGQEKPQQKEDNSQKEINELKEYILKRVDQRLQIEHEKIMEQVRQLLDKELPELYKKAQAAKAEEQKGFLGIGTAALTKEIKTQLGYEGKGGIVITGVFSNTPAARIGLMPGDVITALNGEAVDDVEKFRQALAKHKAGEFVTLKFWRQGNDLSMKVKLAPKPREQQAQMQPQVQPSPQEQIQPQQQIQPHRQRRQVQPQPRLQVQRMAGPGYLGVQLGELDDDKRKAAKYEDDGVVIEKVQPNSPADEAGLEEGDIIEAVNNEYIATLQELRSIIANKRAGETITLTVWHDGKERDVETTLAPMMERPMPPQRQQQRVQPKNDDEGGGYYGGAIQQRVDRFLQSLNEKDKPQIATPKPYLGIQVSESKNGLIAVNIVDDSPAQKAGLAVGDVLKAINGVALESEDAMRLFMSSAIPNSKVILTILRQGKEFTIGATLGAKQ